MSFGVYAEELAYDLEGKNLRVGDLRRRAALANAKILELVVYETEDGYDEGPKIHKKKTSVPLGAIGLTPSVRGSSFSQVLMAVFIKVDPSGRMGLPGRIAGTLEPLREPGTQTGGSILTTQLSERLAHGLARTSRTGNHLRPSFGEYEGFFCLGSGYRGVPGEGLAYLYLL